MICFQAIPVCTCGRGSFSYNTRPSTLIISCADQPMKQLGCQGSVCTCTFCLSTILRFQEHTHMITSVFSVFAMALPNAWLNGPKGRLAPVEQAKLWALRKVSQKSSGDSVQYQWMAMQVSLVGGGHPTRQAVAKFLRLQSLIFDTC